MDKLRYLDFDIKVTDKKSDNTLTDFIDELYKCETLKFINYFDNSLHIVPDNNNYNLTFSRMLCYIDFFKIIGENIHTLNYLTQLHLSVFSTHDELQYFKIPPPNMTYFSTSTTCSLSESFISNIQIFKFNYPTPWTMDVILEFPIIGTLKEFHCHEIVFDKIDWTKFKKMLKRFPNVKFPQLEIKEYDKRFIKPNNYLEIINKYNVDDWHFVPYIYYHSKIGFGSKYAGKLF